MQKLAMSLLLFLSIVQNNVFLYAQSNNHISNKVNIKASPTNNILVTEPSIDKIIYKYHYASILVLPDNTDPIEKKDWYQLYHNAVDECVATFVYPEDFSIDVSKEKQQFTKQCYYKTIVNINNYENNFYFNGKKPEYIIETQQPELEKALKNYLTCEKCSLYTNKNSEIISLNTPFSVSKKVKVFTLSSTQQDIFSNIFKLSNDNTRVIDTTPATITNWVNKMNAAKNRSALKSIMDDFVNHITFEPIETQNELISIGEKIYKNVKS